MFYLNEKKIKDMYNLKKENKREKINKIKSTNGDELFNLFTNEGKINYIGIKK